MRAEQRSRKFCDTVRESRRNEIIRKCCEEWANLFNIPKEYFWKVALPQGLYDLLESWDSNASTLACIAYLEMKGYSIQDRIKEEEKSGKDNQAKV